MRLCSNCFCKIRAHGQLQRQEGRITPTVGKVKENATEKYRYHCAVLGFTELFFLSENWRKKERKALGEELRDLLSHCPQSLQHLSYRTKSYLSIAASKPGVRTVLSQVLLRTNYLCFQAAGWSCIRIFPTAEGESLSNTISICTQLWEKTNHLWSFWCSVRGC